MADAASTIVDYFKKGQLGFISVLANISQYCDCAGASAPVPRIHDIGILASTDPVAIDRASLDLIKSNIDTGTNDLLGQINRLKGENTVDVAEKIGVGSQDYNLINVDENNTYTNSTDQNEEEEDDEFIPYSNKTTNNIIGLNICKYINLILLLLLL